MQGAPCCSLASLPGEGSGLGWGLERLNRNPALSYGHREVAQLGPGRRQAGEDPWEAPGSVSWSQQERKGPSCWWRPLPLLHPADVNLSIFYCHFLLIINMVNTYTHILIYPLCITGFGGKQWLRRKKVSQKGTRSDWNWGNKLTDNFSWHLVMWSWLNYLNCAEISTISIKWALLKIHFYYEHLGLPWWLRQ